MISSAQLNVAFTILGDIDWLREELKAQGVTCHNVCLVSIHDCIAVGITKLELKILCLVSIEVKLSEKGKN